MNRWAPHIFQKRADNSGLPESLLERLRENYSHAHEAGVAPVVSLRHLAFSSDVDYAHLRSRCSRKPYVVVAGRKVSPYRSFAIDKRSGGKRLISVPADDLLRVQRWVHRNILAKQSCHHRAFAYQAQKSIVDCASIHVGCRWLVKIDLSRFFESITERQVYRVFRSIGYPALVSFEMARLCTRVDRVSRRRKTGRKWTSGRPLDGATIPDYSHPHVGYLPQGAPTSPMLSNLVSRDLDESLSNLSKVVGAEYSRYSDDIFFSSSEKTFSKSNAVELTRQAQLCIEKHGFDLNRSKTSIAGPGHRRLVLGILVDRDRLRLSRAFRRRLEWHYRHCLRDPAAHATVKGFNSIRGLRNHLNGLLSFARSVDPQYVAALEKTPIPWPV